jgi:hypothetical protein
MKVVRLSALSAGHLYLLGNISLLPQTYALDRAGPHPITSVYVTIINQETKRSEMTPGRTCLSQAVVLYSVGFILCGINWHKIRGNGGNMCGKELSDSYQLFSTSKIRHYTTRSSEKNRVKKIDIYIYIFQIPRKISSKY